MGFKKGESLPEHHRRMAAACEELARRHLEAARTATTPRRRESLEHKADRQRRNAALHRERADKESGNCREEPDQAET